MKHILTFLLSALFINCYGQNIEKIKVPIGITYNYCDNQTVEKAKKLILENIADSTKITLTQSMLIVGPQLWTRFKDIQKLNEIQGGNTTFHVDKLELKGKMTQSIEDANKVWEEFRKEIKGEYKIRKANQNELAYYWSVISFDIDEPLLIVETKEHNYILNFLKSDLKLMWLDEAPKPKEYKASSVPQGAKETKLERIILLSTDEVIKKNTSVEDISKITDKCSKIFEESFSKSTKEGKILVQFELNKTQNKIDFAVKGDVDDGIMDKFEKRVNSEKFPKSKKDPVGFQLLYKINSYDETE